MLTSIFSPTAEQVGYGTYPWKYVRGLSFEEKLFVKRDGIVVFLAERPSGGNNGTLWRYVIYSYGKYRARVADEDMVKASGHTWTEGEFKGIGN